MRFPQLIVCGPDDWIATQLGAFVAEHGWRLRTARRPAAALELARESRPTVLLVQVDPQSDDIEPFRLVADLHRLRPDAASVIVSDAKLPDDERAAWAAAAFDLGARFVLFPPLTRPVLEDLVSGLMAAAVRRLGPGPGAPA
ncbi:MAG: hypothetical protein ACRC7O_08680 [Fimbriiglobus sp.]